MPPEVFPKDHTVKLLTVAGGRPPDDPAKGPWQRITDWKNGHDGDQSCTQYALLGLHAASRSGVKVPPETWRRALDHQLKGQCKDGGWQYGAGGNEGYGSMTTAGLCAVAICRAELAEPNPTSAPAITRGLAWLAQHFTVDKHANYSTPNQWLSYYLYSVERAGRI